MAHTTEPGTSIGDSREQAAGPISRVSRSKEAARKTYDRLSRWYDLLAGASERPARRVGLALLNAQPGECLLEVGFGTGHGLSALARAVGSGGRVVGMDLSPGMLAAARRRLEQDGLIERVELRQADAATAELLGPFDAAFICFTLELFDTPEIPVVLGKCWQALRTRGRVVVVALSKSGGANPALQLYEWLHRRLPALFDCRPIYPAEALEAAGFRLLERRRISMWGLPVEVALAAKGQQG